MFMKLKWLTLILSLLITACSTSGEDDRGNIEETEEDPDAMYIHFQTGFYQDTVILYHGKEKIYEKVLTSEEGKTPTDRFSIPKSEISDTIKFQVKQGAQVLKGHIPPKAEQHVGFYITAGSAVNIYSKSTPFTY